MKINFFSQTLLVALSGGCIFAAEKSEEVEKSFSLSEQDNQQYLLEKGRKWRIKENIDGINFVDRDTLPTKKGIKCIGCFYEGHVENSTSS